MPDNTEAVTIRRVNGVELFERRVGTGAPVVILHGGPGAQHDYLLPGFDTLAPGRTLIYYDQRGGGRSPVPRDVPVGWREQVADLDALREAWGLSTIALAGYSWGALLALLYAITYPDRVSHAALISPPPAWRGGREEFERRFQARSMTPELQAARVALRESGLRERDPVQHQRRIFELAVAGWFHDPDRTASLTPFRLTDRTQKEVWASLGDYDLRPALDQLAVRATVLHGDDDPIPWETARDTADRLRTEFHLLPDCGHVPYVEAFEDFRRVVDDFLPRDAGP